jgi:preprotein translocase SecE subunit
MSNKKKGKQRKKRVIDSAAQLAEAPGSGIEAGLALDELNPVEEEVKPKKAVKAPEVEKKIEKAVRKPPPKGPGVYASFRKFLKDVQAEAKKVVWPDSEQLKNSTVVVVATILALAAFMGFFSNIFFRVSDLVFVPNPAKTASAPAPGTEQTPGGGGQTEGGSETGSGVPSGAEGTS